MTHGKEVARRLRGQKGGGIPWMAILDAQGKSLITSDGPGGNVGCPIKPEEVAHFIHMLRKTAQRMSAEHIAAVEKELKAYAEKVLQRRAG